MYTHNKPIKKSYQLIPFLVSHSAVLARSDEYWYSNTTEYTLLESSSGYLYSSTADYTFILVAYFRVLVLGYY